MHSWRISITRLRCSGEAGSSLGRRAISAPILGEAQVNGKCRMVRLERLPGLGTATSREGNRNKLSREQVWLLLSTISTPLPSNT